MRSIAAIRTPEGEMVLQCGDAYYDLVGLAVEIKRNPDDFLPLVMVYSNNGDYDALCKFARKSEERLARFIDYAKKGLEVTL